ncbi:MAG: hypothetical protein Q8934_08045 [Bacillota bacterium]|nr:hypothetical protein [Bacillota bacterium]
MMLVEINLLPKNEPKKFGFILVFSLIILLAMLTATFYIWQIHLTKTNIQSTENQISLIQKVTDNQSKQASAAVSTNSVDQLKNGIKVMNNLRIPTIPVMRHLTSLLPQRGFIQSFQYADTGTLTLTVQFDSESEAANYLDWLNHSKWIEDAILTSLNANSNDATASGATTVNSSLDNNMNSTANTNGTVTKSNSNLMPRYVGQFDIKFNKEFVKKKSGSSDEGVTGQ